MSVTQVQNAGLAVPPITLAGSQVLTNKDLSSATNTFPVNFGALSFRNRIINGDMRVQNRPSITISSSKTYGIADRTFFFVSGSPTGVSGSDVISYPNAGTSSGNMYGTTAGSWTTGSAAWYQRIESKNTFDMNSKVLTASAKILQNTGGSRSFSFQLTKPTTTADTFSAETVLQTVAAQSVPSGTLTTVTATFTVLGSTDASLGLGLYVYDNAANTVASKTYLMTDFQLEVGSTATTFESRPYTLEQKLCLRYLPVWSVAATGVYCLAQSTGGTSFIGVLPYIVPPRVVPTGITSTAAANFNITGTAGGNNALTVISISTLTSVNALALTLASAAGGGAGDAAILVSGSGATQILATGCEL